LSEMPGTHPPAAASAAKRSGLRDNGAGDVLVSQSDVDLVYISTPPFLHCEQALKALRAGKHVICEKPLAVTLEQADEMIAEARQRDLLLVANLMQRYNPIYDAVGELIRSRALGQLLHAYFENYASDEGLPPQHWFWDRAKSGGIFIEHGVHFFDMFEGWLGPGEILAAQRVRRPGSGVEEQVQCTIRYPGDVLVNFYHGFHQPARMDRQQMRFVFERGDLTLEEWVPTRVRIFGIASEADMRRIHELFPNCRIDVTKHYFLPEERRCRGRHNEYDVYQMFELHAGESDEKMHVYSRLLRAMLADQIAWIRDRSHRRKITEQNGRNSLATAVAATQLADRVEQGQ